MNQHILTDDANPAKSSATGQSNHLLCPQCHMAHLTRRHCKSLCEQCGYVESCEDNFVPNTANPADDTADAVARAARC